MLYPLSYEGWNGDLSGRGVAPRRPSRNGPTVWVPPLTAVVRRLRRQRPCAPSPAAAGDPAITRRALDPMP